MTITDIAIEIAKQGNNITEIEITSDLSSDEVSFLTEALKSNHCRIQKIDFSPSADTSDTINVIFNLLSSIKNLDFLEELNLFSVHLGSKGISILAPVFEKMPNLNILNLSNNEIGDKGAKSLAPSLEKMTNLQSLNLRGNQIDAEGMRSLAPSLGEMVSLRSLDLGWNRIGAEGMRSLAPSLGEMVSLRSLDLGWNRIGAEGMRSLAPSLEKMTNLEILDLGHNYIGPEGIKSLALFLGGMTDLKSLSLDWNKFDVEAVDSQLLSILKKLSKLVILNLTGLIGISKVLPSFSEGSPNLIFLNGEETKNYDVAKKLAEEINSSGKIKIFEEFLKYSAAVKYFLKEDFKREDLASLVDALLKLEDFKIEDLESSVGYLLKLENFRKNQAEEIKKLVASEEYKLKPKELAEAKIDEIRKGELKLYREFVSSLSEGLHEIFLSTEENLLSESNHKNFEECKKKLSGDLKKIFDEKEKEIFSGKEYAKDYNNIMKIINSLPKEEQAELKKIFLTNMFMEANLAYLPEEMSDIFSEGEVIKSTVKKIFGLGNQGLNPIQITEKALGKEKFESIINSQSHKEVLSLFKFLANNQGSTNLYASFKKLGIELDVPKIEDRAEDAPAPNHEAASSDNQDEDVSMLQDSSGDSSQIDLTGLSNPAAEMQVD